MPNSRRSTTTRDTMRDPRAVAVGLGAVAGALLGIGQLLAAQLTGVLFSRGVNISVQETVDESSIVIWIAAVAVCLGAAVPRMYLKTIPGRRLRLALSGAAACGALLAAPVATATAAWAQAYGSGVSLSNVLRLVLFGVILGAAISVMAVRSNAAAWSLAYWTGVVWVLLLISASANPGMTPVISYLGSGWIQDSRYLLGSLLLLIVATVSGSALGVAGSILHWGQNLRRGHTATPLLSVCGPLVVFAAYTTAGITAGAWDGIHLASLAAAGLLTAMGAWMGACLTRRLRRGRPAGSMGA